MRSGPYFFSFDTKSKPGTILAHCVRFETIEIPAAGFNATEFKILGADYNDNKQIQDALRCAYRFVKENGLAPQ